MCTFGKFVGMAIAFGSVSMAGGTSAVEMRPFLPLRVAQAMAEACLDRAAQEGWKMHVAVVDSGGNLKYYARMDDAQLISHDIALMKARTSAGLPVSTSELAQGVYGDPARSPSPLAFVPGVVLFAGGLPIITSESQHVGGIGVSGSTGENDEICAQAGLDAVAVDLNLEQAEVPAASPQPGGAAEQPSGPAALDEVSEPGGGDRETPSLEPGDDAPAVADDEAAAEDEQSEDIPGVGADENPADPQQ